MNKEKVTISVRIDKDVKEQFAKICKAMGLNISDAINIFARKVVSEQAIPFEVKQKSNQEDTNIKVIKERQMSRQEELAILFPPASAEEVRKLEAKLRRNGNEEKPVMVDSSGQRNAMSHFRKENSVNVGRSNLLGVIPVERENDKERIIITRKYTRTKRDDGLWNFLRPDRTFLSKEWFADAWNFCNGFAVVQREDGLYNYIKTDGTLLSKEGFKFAWNFYNGFAIVQREDGMYNFLKPDGTLLSKEWFANVSSFPEGFAIVQKENGEYGYLKTDGTLCKEK